MRIYNVPMMFYILGLLQKLTDSEYFSIDSYFRKILQESLSISIFRRKISPSTELVSHWATVKKTWFFAIGNCNKNTGPSTVNIILLEIFRRQIRHSLSLDDCYKKYDINSISEESPHCELLLQES